MPLVSMSILFGDLEESFLVFYDFPSTGGIAPDLLEKARTIFLVENIPVSFVAHPKD